MKNVLMTWQSTQLATARRSVMPTDASASVRTRAFDTATVAGGFAGIAVPAAAEPCTAATNCVDATVVASHRGPDAWRPPIC